MVTKNPTATNQNIQPPYSKKLNLATRRHHHCQIRGKTRAIDPNVYMYNNTKNGMSRYAVAPPEGTFGPCEDEMATSGPPMKPNRPRSEEHTSELQSHSFISYAVFCLKTKIRALRPGIGLAILRSQTECAPSGPP